MGCHQGLAPVLDVSATFAGDAPKKRWEKILISSEFWPRYVRGCRAKSRAARDIKALCGAFV
jgi:hypothetical protein